jgi:hypothetical protein
MTPPVASHTVIAPKNHDLQLYPHDGALIDSLTGYIATGLENDESVVVIATAEHLAAIHSRLANRFDLDRAMSQDKYIPIEAAPFLQTFLVNDWPVGDLFIDAVEPVLKRAIAAGTAVRAFGEMVVLLWKKRLFGATVQLEQLWNDLSQHHDFKLLCAYPQSAFDNGLQSALQHICKAHSEMLVLPPLGNG